jgi:hypothetical protein
MEASNLYYLLNLLQGHRAAKAELWLDAPLKEYKESPEDLISKIGKQPQIVKRITWPFTKKEIEHILARMERLKSLLNVALDVDRA